MEIVALLRVLWRLRIAVAVGMVVAIGAALVTWRGGVTTLGVATTRVVLDTPESQLVDPKPVGADTLAWRSALLAELMESDAGRPRIAAAMGQPADRIAIVAPYLSIPAKPSPLAESALAAAAATPEPYVVAVQAPGPLPIISIDATAPSGAEAKRLATAASDALKAAADVYHGNPEELQEFVVDSVGPVRAEEVHDGPRRVATVAVAFVVFALWCAGVLVWSGLMRARRRRMPPPAVRALAR
jgi:hypothetical protein